ncbi:hypothetical protein Scep_000291 [Stephania cephalantha]|uniref:GDSL esterase/lipase EXL3 n=1 Tax=Stephania cephalantha TaxID=152367 RepID=A0AAP0Q2T1_9MAGN
MRPLFFGFILITLLSAETVKVSAVPTTLPKNIHIPAVFAFGDSIVDPGNNNHLYTTLKSNFPPYGRDFIGGKPSGRYSNGKIPTDLLVKLLGLKELLPAYLDPALKPQDLLTGVSFASGGAGYDPVTAQLVTVLGLPDQLNLFKQCIGTLKTIAGEERTANILSNSLFLVFAGSDDIAGTYYTSPISPRRFQYDIQSYTDLMARYAIGFVQDLVKLGARRIGLYGAPPIGCVPTVRTLLGGKQRQCADKLNKAALMFNSKLSTSLRNLKHNPNVTAVYVDLYNPLLELINNPRPHGFEIVDRGCCGTGKVESTMLCNQFSPCTCQDVSKYLFWDSYHPSQKGYEALMGPVIQSSFKSFFGSNNNP